MTGVPPDPYDAYRPLPYGQSTYGQSPYGQQLPDGPAYGYPDGYEYLYADVGPRPASMGSRLGARLIDFLAFSIPAVLLAGIAGGAFASLTGRPASDVATPRNALFIIGFALYEVLFLARTGSTPGKSAVGIKVTRADGSPVGVRVAASRWAILFLPTTVFPFWYLLFGISPFFDGTRRQGWHDKAVGTVVVPR